MGGRGNSVYWKGKLRLTFNKAPEFQQFTSFSFYVSLLSRVKMNSINWSLLKAWVSIAQLVEYFSANAEATGSSPIEASKKIPISGLIRNCLNCDYNCDGHIFI